jgi:hypothetical protein
VKVFISSVRRGLEAERDCLPGLILAIGHAPLRFEDFGSLSVPSREACLRGVQEADVYVLLAGPAYGVTWPDTGLSATHEEYNAAKASGIPRLMFRKHGVDLESAQAAFVAEVEAYSTGLFRNSFVDAVDLQPKVVRALRNLPATGLDSGWVPLGAPVSVEWRDMWKSPPGQRGGSGAAEIELHAAPVEPVVLSARQLRDTSDALARRLRTLGVVSQSASIDVDSDSAAAWALMTAPSRLGGWDQLRPEATLGARVSATGQRSVWQQLPADSMGSLLDPDELPGRFAQLLRILGGVAPPGNSPWALGIGLRPSTFMSVGPISSLGHRQSATGASIDRQSVHIEPDEAVGPGALDRGADDVGLVLTRTLLESFQRR